MSEVIKCDKDKALLAALLNVQKTIGIVKKDSQNPFLKNHYVSINAVLDAIIPALNANDLILYQTPGVVDGFPVLNTTIEHKDGGLIFGQMLLLLKDKDSQSHGSAITYARRYSLMAMLALQAEDDDGHEASRPRETHQPKEERMPRSDDEQNWPEPEDTPQKKAAPKQVSQKDFSNAQKSTVSASSKDKFTGWRAVVFPFKSDYKDLPLGVMAEKDLAYWCANFKATEWKDKEGNMRPPTKKSLDLRKAFDEAQAEMEKKAITAPQDKENEPQVKGDIITELQKKLIALDRTEEWLIRELVSLKKIEGAESLGELSNELLEKINNNWGIFVKKSESMPF